METEGGATFFTIRNVMGASLMVIFGVLFLTIFDFNVANCILSIILTSKLATLLVFVGRGL